MSHSPRFALPDTLYGRERELAALESAFGHTRGGMSQVVLLTGHAGVGKTALVDALRQRHAADAYVLAGKFDPLRRHIAYGAWVAGFAALARDLLTEPPPRLRHWRAHLNRLLRGQLRVIVDMIPEYAGIVGHEPPPLAADAQQHVEIAFRGLIEAVAQAERPLLIFLDDLQWADGGSLQILAGLLEDSGLRHTMIICAYRDNEVSAVHPLIVTLDAAQQSRQLRSLHLYPLEATQLNRLVSDALRQPPESTRPLADWLHQRSDGNPLFARQLLLALREHGAVCYSGGSGGWSWALEGVAELGLADDVLELLADKIRRLPPASQACVSTAACLGATVDSELLAVVCEYTAEQLQEALLPAADAQLLLPGKSAAGAETESWRFSHDRVQQVAYCLIAEAERPRRHLAIARRLRAHLAGPALESHLFELANQFNEALTLLDEPAERLAIARLNLEAGRRVKAAGAFEAACRYFSAGQSLLPERSWTNEYALTYALSIERAGCGYVLGDLEQADALFDEILANAREREDQARAYLVKIVLATNADDPRLAIRLGARCLALFGVDLPTATAEATAAVDAELERVRQQFESQPLDRFSESDDDADPARSFVAEALMRLLIPAYQCGVNLLVLVTLKLLNAALERRDRRTCAFAFMNYSLILGPFLGDYQRGEQFARLAMDLGRQLKDPGAQAKLLHVYSSTGSHWTQPIRRSTEQLHEAHRLATEAADPLFCGLTASFLLRSMIISGDHLDDILDEWDRYRPLVVRLRSEAVSTPLQLARQWALALKGQTRRPTSMSDEQFDEDAIRAALYASEVRSPLHWYCVLKAMLHYYAGELELAEACIREADSYVEWAFGQAAVPEQLFFEGLILSGRYPQLAPAAQATTLATLAARQRRLHEWAVLAPDNYTARAQLLAAELARLRGETQSAMSAYEAAIHSARAADTPHVLALGHELAGRFYRDAGFEAMARAHLSEAHHGYLRWGAAAKAQRLATELPELIAGTSLALAAGTGADSDAAFDAADVATIAKASQALDGQLDLPQLLANLLGFAMENAGADRVLLLLQRDGDLYVEAETLAGRPQVSPPRSAPLDEHSDCAVSVIHYVCRTRKPLTIAAAGSDRSFAGDPWIVRRQLQSILCLPIIRQGELFGLLYLENTASGGAFSRRRAALLELLTAQVATSLENALLHDKLKREIQERQRAETAARESERRWRSFLDNARLAVVGLDLEGRIEYVNPYLLELSGYRRSDLIGRNWFTTMLPGRHQRRDFQQRYFDLLRDRPYSSVRGALMTQGLEERQLAWSNAWLRDAQGDVVGTVSIGEDISERLRAERENRRLNHDLENRVALRTAELAAANGELEAFAYSVSHDLRAPLRSIDGFSQALIEDYGPQLTDEGREHLARVRRASQRMGELIDAILQMSRLTRGELRQEWTDLSALAAEVADDIRERHPEHAMRFDIEPRLFVRGDPRLLRIVMENLLGNAWKYSRGTEQPTCRFHRVMHQREPAFCVSDNGAGFDMRYVERLFGTFQRLHNEAEFEGTGIGLAMVQRIIRRHGGRIWAEGSVGRGARFYFVLPHAASDRPLTPLFEYG